MTILALLQLAKASVNGAFEPLPSSFIFWNTGNSFNFKRITTETPSRTTDSRNGTRQPQAANSVSPSSVRVKRITSRDRNRPERRRGLNERGVVPAFAVR